MGHVVVDQRIAQEVLGWDGPLFMMVDPSTVMLQTECLEVDSSREAQPTVPADWDRHQSALGVSADVSLTILSAQGARPASVRALSCTRRGECNDGPRVLVSLGYPYPPGPPPSAVSAAREGVVPLQAKVVAVPADDKGCESRSIGKSAIERSPCRTVRRTLRSSSPPEGEIEILAARLQDPTECEQWRTLARVRSGDGPFSRWRTVLHSNRAPKVWAIFAPGAPDRFLIAAEYGCSGGGQTLRMIGLDGRVGFTVGREYVTGGANCD